jgi:tungstate transport system ATP-binding protein
MPDASSPIQPSPQSSLLPLEVTSLCYRIEQKLLLDNLDVSIASKGITAVLGPNGAGKSLFLRLIHGLLTPTSGHILWNGRDLDLATRQRQALVFQKPVLMRRSVAANIDFVLKSRGRQGRQQRAQILQRAGLARQSNQPARLLSGGEQQRLALARALATEPEILLLDEPCASIDASASLQIEQLLQQSRDQGVKILLVTHDSGQARRLADDILFLHNGRLLEYSPAARFFAGPSSEPARHYLEGRLVL